ncbi:unnamed protein product [Didymodactylos carnosus]|uniref:C2 domain-containing protein n=1 Tax=Didymodactylos carnosus TaxID=1234261 RepID=A0A815GD78_9BILA|nr:unnamed protein product [Didymodactylos carnosus]CAF1336851.1 unnamed protein product [Didymodactylos carnosus]CAF4054782.1 unnamed protein product [Didymodactylos carnosus]CAF4194662.1 unnamed protein product [Didymodactylos carnosus]
MTHGQLQVTVIEARDLYHEDLVDKNDPYVEVSIDKHYKQRTSTQSNTDSPSWNETLILPVPQGHHHLHVHVFDADIVGHDLIGSAKIDLNPIILGKPFDGWVKLPTHLHLSSHGEVHLSIQYIKSS